MESPERLETSGLYRVSGQTKCRGVMIHPGHDSIQFAILDSRFMIQFYSEYFKQNLNEEEL